jgi:hypothetical protein
MPTRDALSEHRAPTPEQCRAHAAECLRTMQFATVEEVGSASS